MLVTGGAGFIGSNFIHYMLAQYPEVEIVNLDKLTYAGSLGNLKTLPASDRYHFVKGDICDEALVSRLLSDFSIDTVVHFAAESHVDRSIIGPGEFVQTNVVGSFVLLEACRKFWQERYQLDVKKCRFHHISTDEVYGTLSKDAAAFSEKTAYAPNSPYSASKAGADHLARAYFHTYGLPVTMTNCSNNYGAFQHDEKFIPTVIRSCLQGKVIPIYGDGSNIRDWLYVKDHCAAIDKVIRLAPAGEVYNVGGDSEVANIDLVKKICGILDDLVPAKRGYAELITYVDDRKGHDWRYAIDFHKINQMLAWSPRVTLLEGLRRTVDFYREKYVAS